MHNRCLRKGQLLPAQGTNAAYAATAAHNKGLNAQPANAQPGTRVLQSATFNAQQANDEDDGHGVSRLLSVERCVRRMLSFMLFECCVRRLLSFASLYFCELCLSTVNPLNFETIA